MTRSPIAAVLLATATLTFHVDPVAAEVVVPGEFEVRQVYSGAPLSGISGLAIGQGSRLWLSATGPVPHGGNQKIVRLDFLTGTASVLLEGLPLGTPARILVGDGVRYPLSSIIVARSKL